MARIGYENLAPSVEARRNATHCHRGHSDWGRNKANGHRFCRTCKIERQRLYRGLKSGRLKHDGLMDIDLRVIEGAVEGLTNREMGERFFYAEKSISFIRNRIYKRLGAEDFFDAIFVAYAKGLIGGESIDNRATHQF